MLEAVTRGTRYYIHHGYRIFRNFIISRKPTNFFSNYGLNKVTIKIFDSYVMDITKKPTTSCVNVVIYGSCVIIV